MEQIQFKQIQDIMVQNLIIIFYVHKMFNSLFDDELEKKKKNF